MHRETKATAISAAVKAIVWRRDCCRCVICGSVNAGPHCHFVRRSQGGLGVEKNVWTGCEACHSKFDSEGTSGPLHGVVKAYLLSWYPDWDESQLIYKKYGGTSDA